MLVIDCTPQDYPAVAARIEKGLAAHGTLRRHVDEKSSLPRLLGLTMLTVAACVPAFLQSEAFHVSLLLPIALLCFALTTAWLLPLFGYVNLDLIALNLGEVIVDAFSERQSYFNPANHYQRWTVYDGNDRALLVLAGLGFAWLIYFSRGALRGASSQPLPAMPRAWARRRDCSEG